jgi:hypothetical protein
MNTPLDDENLARRAFTAAFRSGATGEPPVLPDVESLVNRGRRASRQRHGVYAAGTTALAGVVTAGVVTAPTLLGLGSTSPSGISAGAAAAGGTTAAEATSKPSDAPGPAKPSSGVTCPTPLAIDWATVLSSALPAGLTASADHFANCVQTTDGSRTVEALFTLSTGAGVQLNVNTGPGIAAKLNAAQGKAGAAANATGPSGPGEAALEASKLARAGLASAAPGASTSLDPAAIASLDAEKHALANAAATSTASPTASDSPDIMVKQGGNCTSITPTETICVSHLTKGSLSVVDVQIMRIGVSPVLVDAVASNGKNSPTPVAGLLPTDATMVAIAKAVAARF